MAGENDERREEQQEEEGEEEEEEEAHERFVQSLYRGGGLRVEDTILGGRSSTRKRYLRRHADRDW